MSASSTSKTKIMQLSQSEYVTLSTTGTLTKDGVTYTYSPSDTIYVTPENTEYAPNIWTMLDLTSNTANNPLDLTTLPNGNYLVTAEGYVGYTYDAGNDYFGKVKLLTNAMINKQGSVFNIINRNNIFNGTMDTNNDNIRSISNTTLNVLFNAIIDVAADIYDQGGMNIEDAALELLTKLGARGN